MPRLTLLKFLYFVSPFDWELLGGQGVFNFTYVLRVLAGHGVVVAWRQTETQRTTFVTAMMIMCSAAFMAYVFSYQVKRFSADILRSVGIW